MTGTSMTRVYGYVRPTVSHPDPSTHVQQLAAAGAQTTFVETNSAQSRRGMRERQRLFQQIAPDDTLILTSLDRLGTSLEDVLRCLATLVDRGVRIKILDSGFETAGTSGVVDLLALLVETVSKLHSETVKLNLAAARKNGGKAAGKPSNLTLEQWPTIKARIEAVPLEAVAKELGVSRQTLWTYRRRMAAQDGAAAS